MNRVNFSSCNLSHEGANILATLIKVQALKRHNEAWKDSLRYGRPDLDSMFGIRRITINSNTLIGDDGVKALSDAFKSDLWLKALDLQDCGITTKGAQYLLDGLKFNAMMHVLDVRLNVNIDRDTLQKIMEQVMINSSGNNTDYEWMDLAQTASTITTSNQNNHYVPGSIITSSSNIHQQQQQQVNKNRTSGELNKKIKKRRNTNASFNKKNQLNAINNLIKMKRCKSTGSVICNKSPNPNNSTTNNKSSNALSTSSSFASPNNNSKTRSNNGGIPWRTAARANKYRVSTSCLYRKVGNNNEEDEYYDDENEEYDENQLIDDIVEDVVEEEDEDQDQEAHFNKHTNINKPKPRPSKKSIMMASSTFDFDKFASSKILPMSNSKETGSSSSRNKLSSLENLKTNNKTDAHHHNSKINFDKIENMSFKDLILVLKREQEAKTQLEDMLLSVSILLLAIFLLENYLNFSIFYHVVATRRQYEA